MPVEVRNNISERSAARLKTWLSEESWPTPMWLTEDFDTGEPLDYQSYYAYFIRARYVQLESDFRTIVPAQASSRILDMDSADRCFSLLVSARLMLEMPRPKLLEVSSLLDLVEQYMIWTLPPQVLVPRMQGSLARLERVGEGNSNLASRLARAVESSSSGEYWQNRYIFGEVRGLVDEALRVVNAYSIQEVISAGLQLQRLKMLRYWGVITLVILIVTSPLTTKASQITSDVVENGSTLYAVWVVTMGIAVVGAVGGFLSGLLQVRGSTVTLSEFQESVLKFQLKPIIGGILAIVLLLLLSWGVLPGITVESSGTYVLLAFLAGFSERYFFNVLNLEPQEGDRTPPMVHEQPVITADRNQPLEEEPKQEIGPSF